MRTLASLAGFVPRIAHEIDSLELVEDLILAGYGVGAAADRTPNHRLCQGTSTGRTQGDTHRLRSHAPRAGNLAAARTVLDRMRPPPGTELPPPKWPRPAPEM